MFKFICLRAIHASHAPRCLLLISLLAAPCVLSGCTTAASAPPPQAATDSGKPTRTRLAAIDAYPQARVFELFEMVAVSRHPIRVRTAAVDRMIDTDADRFWQTAALRSAQIDDWPMIRLLCQRAQATSDARALPWLIRSWAVPSTTVVDSDRPERAAIATSFGNPVETTLHASVFPAPVFKQRDSLAVRVAAWTVLCRMGPMDDQLRNGSLKAKISRQHRDPLLDALYLCYDALRTYPTDREGMARLFTLIDQAPKPQWQAWTDWRDLHHIDLPSTLALRHLPAISRIAPDQYGWTRKKWLAHTAQRLEKQRHFQRGQNAGDQVITARPESLADHADALGIADCVVLNALLDALDDEPLVAELFRQADADRLDATTELGGVIAWDDKGNPVATAFAPLIKQHDQVYYASHACVRAMHTGLAHYHFHAQQHDSAPWAGPGKGDLGFADRMHANCVVFTFIDANTLNADAYFPGGVIIDLGCISRQP